MTTDDGALDINGIMRVPAAPLPVPAGRPRARVRARASRSARVKNVTMNEPFFPGHFPGYPVMPGVLVIEALAQAVGDPRLPHARAPRAARARCSCSPASTTRASSGRWCPGDQLILEVEVLRIVRGVGKFAARATRRRRDRGRGGADGGDAPGTRAAPRTARLTRDGAHPPDRASSTPARGSPPTSRSARTRSSART